MSSIPTKKISVGFTKGIDRDTVVSKYDPNTYFDATDLRIISKGTLSNGSLTNVIGNKEKILLEFPNEVVVGSATIKDDLVLFSKYGSRTDMFYMSLTDQAVLYIRINGILYSFKIIASPEATDPQYLGYIYTTYTDIQLAEYFSSFPEISDYFLVVPNYVSVSAHQISFFAKVASNGYSLIITPSGGITRTEYTAGSKISFVSNYNSITGEESPTVIFDDQDATHKLNFLTSDYISSVSRYESDSVKKVYWANNIDPLRYVNIADYGTISEASEFDHIPNVEFSEIEVSVVNGGNLKAGVVQYSYQFYNKYGAASTFSPPSRTIKLSKTKDTFGGSDLGESVNKSVKIEITNTNTIFNSVRIISIFYDTYESTPTLSIIYDSTIEEDQANISHIDNGSSIGSISLEEFRVFSATTFIPKVIETKNNYLFLGNITENTFTSDVIDLWDSRAYQFDTYNGNAKIYNTPIGAVDDDNYVISYNGSGTYYPKTGSSTPIYEWNVPESFSCCNRDNSIFDNECSVPTYKCNPDIFGSSAAENIIKKSNMVFGGKGKNLSFKFYKYINPERNASYDETIKEVKHDTKISGSVVNSEYITECTPNEVYRIGIRFFNNKGQSSYVKWIADVRWPYIEIQDTSVLEVTVNTFPDDSTITHYQIVRVKRDVQDTSIRTTGLIAPTRKELRAIHSQTDLRYMRTPFLGYDSYSSTDIGAMPNMYSIQTYSSGWDKSVVEFFSPEVIFNSPNLDYLKDSKLVISNIISATTNVTYTEGSEDDTYDVSSYFLQNNSECIYETDDLNLSSTFAYVIKDFIKPDLAITKEDLAIQKYTLGVSGKYYENKFSVYENGSSINPAYASRSTFPVLLLDNDLDIIYNDTTGLDVKYLTGSILSDVDSSRYGGYTFYNKSNNEYIDFSDIQEISTSAALCKYGDSYSYRFWFMRAYYYAEDKNTAGKNTSVNQHCFTFLPTKIDTRYANTDVSAILGYQKIQETAETGILLYPLEYSSTIKDLYIYNPVYSTVADATLALVKPINFESIDTIETKVLASERKINNEYIDPWTNYVSSNYIEVDAAYGEIVGLSAFKGDLHFFQTGATGKLAVEDRSLISDSNGEQLSLGLSGVLSRFDYLTFSGPLSPHSILPTKNDLYYIDSYEKRIYSALNDTVSFSEQLGISSLLNDTITIDSVIRCGYDYEYKEALFSIDSVTLCLNENTQAFTSRYSFTPDIFITTKDSLLSAKTDFSQLAASYIYKHNEGVYGYWYPKHSDYGYSTSSLSVLFVPEQDNTVIFDAILFRTEIYNSDEKIITHQDILKETISRVKFSNSYIQEITSEAVVSDYDMNAAKRFLRKWRMQVPLTQNSNRFADSYMLTTFEYDNNNNKSFKITDITAYFRSAK